MACLSMLVSFWFFVSVCAHVMRPRGVLGVLGASWVAGDPEPDRDPNENETTDGPVGTAHESDSFESDDSNARSETLASWHSGKHATTAPWSLSSPEGEMHKKSQARKVLGINGRKLENDPSDHYFCGVGFDDASESCEHPCPSGSLRECPLGMLCYFNTPCDRKDLPDQPTKYPTIRPGWRPPSQSPWMAGDERLSFFCGKTWDDASSKCGTWCPDTDDTVCPYGELKTFHCCVRYCVARRSCSIANSPDRGSVLPRHPLRSGPEPARSARSVESSNVGTLGRQRPRAQYVLWGFVV